LCQYLHSLRDDEQVTVIVTPHLLEPAERCDRLARGKEGGRVARGTTLALTPEICGAPVSIAPAHHAQRLPARVPACVSSRPAGALRSTRAACGPATAW